MTDTKLTNAETPGLSETSTTQGLNLLEPAVKFLNFPHKEKFMSSFVIGNNPSKTGSLVTRGLKFYGLIPIMTQYSELIKSSLDVYASSQQPYPLLTFGTVLERPMTLVWLELNDFPEISRNEDLNLEEWLHLYRLMGYFGMDTNGFNTARVVLNFLKNSSEDNKKVLSDEKNRDTFTKLLNKELSGGYVGPLQAKQLFDKLTKDSSEISKELRFIPVYVNDKIITYADRKSDGKTLGRVNWAWYGESPGTFSRTSYDGLEDYVLTVKQWESDVIKLEYKLRSAGTTYVAGKPVQKKPPAIENILSPILLE